ncbi:MAG: (Fe-S)-binding protein [Bacteroidales bacterium]|nr:(Fe-S)-binding protein [Bacteroidales bacterium]
MRNSGIKTGDKTGSYSEVEVFSCSSCGICIDTCQLNTSAAITNIQSAYLMKAIRNNSNVAEIAHNCLMCGRCDQVCPVGIELSPIRMIQRRAGENDIAYKNTYKDYFRTRQITASEKPDISPVYNFLPEVNPDKADVLYFAGCMTHLTPSIKNSMVRILEASGLNYKFIDEDGGACCGRPLMLAGQDREARELINYNSQLIWKSGAQTLVTSCPICYKVFRESYYLDVEVLHHSQFIKNLIDEDIVKLNFLRKKVVYHTPCDLGRGSGVYNEPKEVLTHISRLEKSKFEDDKSLCCGGSLANMKIGSQKRSLIARDAAAELTRTSPDILATACPLCKKTFSSATTIRVADIAELVAEALIVSSVKRSTNKKIFSAKELAAIS